MTRRAVPRLLAGLLAAAAATLGTAVPAPATAASEPTAARTPLQVSVETLAPATIPERGRVTLTGQVTNRSKETWTDLKVYLLTSTAPLRDRAELARADASEADTQVGVRRTAPGLYDEVGDLAPGGSAPYRLSVSRADLGISGEPGVYWVGVHVLGAHDGERDAIADGRARTFMPLLPAPGTAAAAQAVTRLALVVPVREPVHRGGATRLLAIPDWDRALAADGRLDRLLRLSGRAGQALTWVVDPAVLDAVQSVARDNPKLDIGPTGRGRSTGPSGAPAQQPSGAPSTASPSPPSGSGSAGSDADTSEQPSAAALRARAWLEEFRRQAPAHTVMTLPYGDLDAAAVLDSPLPTLYQRATTLSDATAADYGVDDPLPVLDPLSGYLPGTALRRLSSETTVLLARSAVPRASGVVVGGRGRAPVVLTDPQAGSGGPKPTAQYAALAVRQRLLSDAALHALSAQRDDPLVVSMPAHWDPGNAWQKSRFFGGLDQPWLQMVDLPSVTTTASGPTASGTPPSQTGSAATTVYPSSERAAEVPLRNLQGSEDLIRTAGIFARVLTANDTVDDVLARVALLGSSLNARADPDRAFGWTSNTVRYVRSQMALVHIEGPPFVMMSGESGPIQVTLVNDLEQTVTVGLAVSTPGSRLRIAKVDPVTLGPGRRTSIRLEASSDDIGVHSVTLQVVDADGVPLGSETRFSVRTSHVSTVIWVIMGAGGVLLLLAIVVRLFRRIRRRRATHGPLLSRERTGRTGRELRA